MIKNKNCILQNLINPNLKKKFFKSILNNFINKSKITPWEFLKKKFSIVPNLRYYNIFKNQLILKKKKTFCNKYFYLFKKIRLNSNNNWYRTKNELLYLWNKIKNNTYFKKFKLFWKIPVNGITYKKEKFFWVTVDKLLKKDTLQAKMILEKLKKYTMIFRKINRIENPMSIKDKIINHIMKDGKKETSENILRKSFKKLNWDISKPSLIIFKLCVSNSIPLFKLHTSTNKKVKKKKRTVRITPVFIRKFTSWMSLGLKFILKNLKQKSSLNYSDRLVSEILINVKENSNLFKLVDDIHQEALGHKKYKKYLKNYRWSK